MISGCDSEIAFHMMKWIIVFLDSSKVIKILILYPYVIFDFRTRKMINTNLCHGLLLAFPATVIDVHSITLLTVNPGMVKYPLPKRRMTSQG